MIEAPDFLPLGSVVRLEGTTEKKLMIVGRAITIRNPEAEGKLEYFDYALCLYPEGMVGDAFIYSNHNNVKEVISEGYRDDEDKELISTILEVLAEVEDIDRGEPSIEDTW